jgi:hypothetical protein
MLTREIATGVPSSLPPALSRFEKEKKRSGPQLAGFQGKDESTNAPSFLGRGGGREEAFRQDEITFRV